jgi:hypothetical protein
VLLPASFGPPSTDPVSETLVCPSSGVKPNLDLPRDLLPRLRALQSKALEQEDIRQFQRLEGLQRKIEDLYVFLDQYVFGFIKFFDSENAEEHEENYYMEREWRIFGNVNFNLADVHRLLLPKSYASRFHSDFPDYAAQLTYSDST